MVRFLLTPDGAPRYWLQAIIGGTFLASAITIAVRLA